MACFWRCFLLARCCCDFLGGSWYCGVVREKFLVALLAVFADVLVAFCLGLALWTFVALSGVPGGIT
jgi:hypothetical protein